MRRWLSLWAPVLLWMAAIFSASARSDIGLAGEIPDYLTHGAAWFLGSGLACRALAGGLRPLGAGRALLAVGLVTGYGVLDEWHQAYTPGRHASAADVAKDLAGASLAAVAFRRRYPDAAAGTIEAAEAGS